MLDEILEHFLKWAGAGQDGGRTGSVSDAGG